MHHSDYNAYLHALGSAPGRWSTEPTDGRPSEAHDLTLDADDETADLLTILRERRVADRIDGYDRDDLGESPDY